MVLLHGGLVSDVDAWWFRTDAIFHAAFVESGRSRLNGWMMSLSGRGQCLPSPGWTRTRKDRARTGLVVSPEWPVGRSAPLLRVRVGSIVEDGKRKGVTGVVGMILGVAGGTRTLLRIAEGSGQASSQELGSEFVVRSLGLLVSDQRADKSGFGG